MTDQKPDVVKPKVLAGLGCASCGGNLEVEEGLTNVACRYCGTRQALVGERGVIRLMVLEKVDRVQAARALRSWFKKGIRKAPALTREARFEEGFLAFFPFVRLRFDVVGWVLGTRNRKRKKGNRWGSVFRLIVSNHFVSPVTTQITSVGFQEHRGTGPCV